MGLSARALLDRSTHAKPEFQSFWDKQRKKVEYPVRLVLLETLVLIRLVVRRKDFGNRAAGANLRQNVGLDVAHKTGE
jgi:hypothetical protein